MGANATMLNDQADRQRLAIRNANNANISSEDLGNSYNNTSSLFSKKLIGTDLRETKNIFDKNSIDPGSNPDFAEEVTLSYEKGSDLFSDVESEQDRPNIKGPQLKTIKISSDGTPDIENSSLTSGTGLTLPKDRGYGVRINETESFPGRYRKRNEDEDNNVKLGEYIDRDIYSWSDE